MNSPFNFDVFRKDNSRESLGEAVRFAMGVLRDCKPPLLDKNFVLSKGAFEELLDLCGLITDLSLVLAAYEGKSADQGLNDASARFMGLIFGYCRAIQFTNRRDQVLV